MSRQSLERDRLSQETPSGGIIEKIDGDTNYERGTTVPTDAATGYTPGCMYIKTDGGVGTTLYVNEGTAASCDFNAK